MERLRPGDPETIGTYSLIARLGAGGMGTVFLGTKGVERVAIKVVRNTFLDDPSLRTRFEREIATLRKLDSRYIARFVDSGSDNDVSWHASEFVNGSNLRQHVDSLGPLSEEAWWRFAEELRQGLADIHDAGVVHRDLKPSNIVMSETGIKLIDFGIATDSEATSVTVTGMVAGSPAWLAPEHLDGREITSASDLFSAGSVLVYAATGRSPWGDETKLTMPTIYQRILNASPSLDSMAQDQRELLSPRQQSIVSALLEREPSARSFPAIRGGGEMQLANGPLTVPVPSSGDDGRKGSPVAALVAGGLVVLGLLATAAFWMLPGIADDPPPGLGIAGSSEQGLDGAEPDDLISARFDLRGATFTLGSRSSDDQLIVASMLAQLFGAAGADVYGIPGSGSAQVRDWLEAGAVDAYPEFDDIGWRWVTGSDRKEGEYLSPEELDRQDRSNHGIAWLGTSTLTNEGGGTLYLSANANLADEHNEALSGITSELFNTLSPQELDELAESVSNGDHWDIAGHYLVGKGMIRTVPPQIGLGEPGYTGDLRVGDCYNPVATFVSGEPDIYRISCDNLHTYEMFERVSLGGDIYPGDESLIQRAQGVCEAEFDDFVGTPYLSSTLWTFGLYPNQELWELGDRDVFCIISDQDRYVVGSLEGARR